MPIHQPVEEECGGYKNINGISFNYGNIRRIYTNAQDKEPAGARIEIYAQRA